MKRRYHNLKLLEQTTEPQTRFIFSRARYKAIIGGMGSGKTEALIIDHLLKKLQHPRYDTCYMMPSYNMIRNIAMPRMVDKILKWGFKVNVNRQDNFINIFYNDYDLGKIYFRNMDPDKIIAYESFYTTFDELDTLSTEKAEQVFMRAITRNRKKVDGKSEKENGMAIGTTQETYNGKMFVYNMFKDYKKDKDLDLIQCSTYSNQHNLGEGYIENMIKYLPLGSEKAYIYGEFGDFSNLVALIRTDWFDRFTIEPKFESINIFADTAFKTGNQNDYSVFLCAGLFEGHLYITDVLRGKWESYELKNVAKDFFSKQRKKYGATLRYLFVEDKASGTTIIQEIKKEGYIPVKPIARTTDKVTRIMEVLPHLNSKYVRIKEDHWNSEFLEEMKNFNKNMTHKHDDQVDTLIDAINEMLISNKHAIFNIAGLAKPFTGFKRNLNYTTQMRGTIR